MHFTFDHSKDNLGEAIGVDINTLLAPEVSAKITEELMGSPEAPIGFNTRLAVLLAISEVFEAIAEDKEVPEALREVASTLFLLAAYDWEEKNGSPYFSEDEIMRSSRVIELFNVLPSPALLLFMQAYIVLMPRAAEEENTKEEE